MAERADGSIVVSVDMDAEGFKAGSAELQRAVKSFSAQAEKIGPAFQKAMSGNLSAIAAFNGKAQLLESTMANVRREMTASADKLVDTQESEALASAAEKAEQAQAQLQKSIAGTQEKLEKAKISAQGYYDEVARAQASTDAMLKNADTGEQVDRVLEIEKQELDQIEKKYASQIGKVKELTASLEGQKQKQAELTRQAEEFKAQSQQAMKPLSQTEWYGQIARSLKQASAELANMKGDVQRVGEELAKGGTKAQETTRQSAASMGKLSQKSKEASGHVNKTASAGGKLSSHLRKALGYVGRMVSGLSRMAFHSRDTSRGMQGLLSSIKRLTPALLMAEGVMGLLRKAVSAYMQENQQMANTLNACWSSIGNMLGPIIERLVSLVALASAYFTRFLQLLGFVGKSTSKAISTAGGAAAGAAKKLERQLASFDELNILSGHDTGSGGGGADIGDLGAELPQVELPDWAKLVAQQLKDGNWAGAATTLAEALNGMADAVNWAGLGDRLAYGLDGALAFLAAFLLAFDWLGLGKNLAAGVNQILTGVDWTNLGTVLAGKFRIILLTAAGFLEGLNWSALADAFSAFAKGFFDGISDAVSRVDWGLIARNISTFIQRVDWGGVGTSIGKCLNEVVKAVGKLVGNLDWKGLGKAVASGFMGIWNAIEWDKAAQAVSDGLIGLLDAISGFLEDMEWQKLGRDTATFISKIDWSGIFGALSEGIGAALGGLTALLWGFIKTAWGSVVSWWKEVAYEDGHFTIEGLLMGIADAVANLGGWVLDHIVMPFINGSSPPLA